MSSEVEKARNELSKAAVHFAIQGKDILRINTEEGTVIYYPLQNKWQCQGRKYNGDMQAFIGWVRKRHPIK